MEQSVGVMDLFSTLLDEGKYKEASCLLLKDEHVNIFKNDCWDIISVIIDKIQNDTITLKPSLYGACEELLEMVVQHSIPEAALLDFVEKIEAAKNDAQFSIILKPLQQVQLKLTKSRSLEWCLNAISTYIDKIPVPEYQLDGKERLLMDSDDDIRRILFIYSLLPPYYSPFLKEVVSSVPNSSNQILSVFLISLLGKPLIYVDVDPHSNSSSEARKCSSTIINDICKILKNAMKLLVYVESNYKEGLKPKSSKITNKDKNLSPFENMDKINMTTLSGFYYGVLSDHFEVPKFAFPQVYSDDYVIHTVLLCVVHLLQDGKYGALAKGISLCKAIIKRLSTNKSHSVLSVPVHYNLCNCLINVSIYCSFESIRKEAVILLSLYINSFNYKGRCMLIKYVIEEANHSGMIGYAITLFKNSLDTAFKECVLPECFRDEQFIDMIKKICYLPFGAESDLVEHADQIISSLNFLIYLVIKDKSNLTGISDYLPTLETEFLEKLRIALNMSKAHYEVKLKEIEQNKGDECSYTTVSVIGGNMLDKIPAENKKQIIHSALNAFHLMNGLLAQLSEHIHHNRNNM